MSDDHLQEPLNDDADDRGGDRIQESVFGDVVGAVAAFTGAGGLGINAARYRLDWHDHHEAQLRAELEAARQQLDLERRQHIVALYGLEALDRYDGFDYFRGFGVEGDDIDLANDDWFG
jgi:hypothetical protein